MGCLAKIIDQKPRLDLSLWGHLFFLIFQWLQQIKRVETHPSPCNKTRERFTLLENNFEKIHINHEYNVGEWNGSLANSDLPEALCRRNTDNKRTEREHLEASKCTEVGRAVSEMTGLCSIVK